MNIKEEEIRKVVKEVTGIEPSKKEGTGEERYFDRYNVKNLLILSSSYDYFLLEEEGRLRELFQENFSSRDFGVIPNLSHVEDAHRCLDIIEKSRIDLLIVINEPEMDIIDFSKKVKSDQQVSIVVLGNDTNELQEISSNVDEDLMEGVFTWNGDGKIILSIVQYLEDRRNLENGTLSENGSAVLLIEDSIQYYSSYLPIVYEEIWKYMNSILENDLPRDVKMKRYWSRPFLLLAKDIDQGKEYYQEYRENIQCLITDNHCGSPERREEHVGFSFAVEVEKDDPEINILLQSSEPIEELPEESRIQFVHKRSPALNATVGDFIENCIGPVDLVIENEHGVEIASVETVEEFEKVLWNLEVDMLDGLLEEKEIQSWLRARMEYQLADMIGSLTKIKDPEKKRTKLLRALEEHKYGVETDVISSFKSREKKPSAKITRIGKGALGGKARGLAFMAKILSKYITEDMFENLNITIPRSIVLSTDVYESFLDKNDLIFPDIEIMSDDRISSKFIDSSLPATVLGDIRSFIRETRKPIIVRSSGVLEDSMVQPFAGIYSSMLLPNESWETDLRFQEVCNAIKQVYASTFFERARTYLKSTTKNIGDEKMGVIIQEVVGSKHENYFYPTISGVAKSYSHYPSGKCKPEDGIVYLALGLGKAIVEGGNTYCFCPKHPKVPLTGTPKDYMKYAQRKFYAIDLESVYKKVKKNEETSIVELGLKKAEQHDVLDKVVSTYSMENDRLYPGTGYDGSRIVDFAPIINYGDIPLAKAIDTLLMISEIALGYPVEIEFALNLGDKRGKPSELIILQIRSMMSQGGSADVSLEEYDLEELLCRSDNALGNGVIEGIRDIVYVDPSEFEMENSRRAVEQIRKKNKRFVDQGVKYLLVGPGRWGTSDHWLGIPVQWSDIAGAKVIIETPTKDRHIEPSQGSHFFHDMISAQAGYLITQKGEGDVDWGWLESQESVGEKEDIKHVKTEEPVEVRIDGKSGKGIVIKRRKEKDVN